MKYIAKYTTLLNIKLYETIHHVMSVIYYFSKK